MQIYESKMFPAQLPVIVEDELFLYPFMITPLFLSDEENIEALNLALECKTKARENLTPSTTQASSVP